MVPNQQQIEKASISGNDYNRLQGTITSTNYDDLLNGVKSRTYSEAKFKADFKKENGGFQVSFDGKMFNTHFNWRQIVSDPSMSMFFGDRLLISRYFDCIFKDAEFFSITPSMMSLLLEGV